MRNLILITLLLLGWLTCHGEYPAIVEKDFYEVSHDLFSLSKYSYQYTQEITVSRKVKINTQSALEEFSTLYIPTYEDLDINFILVDLAAKTIKKNGEEIAVNQRNIKETTLPANVPFLYNYKGKVKQLAFENLEIGDAIEYTYTTRLTRSLADPRIQKLNTYFVGNKYPTSHTRYKCEVSGRYLQLQTYIENQGNAEITQSNNLFEAEVKSLNAFPQEYLSIPYENQPYIISAVSDRSFESYEDWESMVRDKLVNFTRKSDYFFGGLSLNELANLVEETDPPEVKLRAIKTKIDEVLKEEPDRVMVHLESSSPDMYDVSQLLKLLRMIKVEGNIILAKSRYNGPIVKQFMNIAQFDDVFITFKDGNGETRFWDFFKPFSSPDEIDYRYGNAECLLISDMKEVSFSTLPGYKSFNASKTINIKMQAITQDAWQLSFTEEGFSDGYRGYTNQISYKLEQLDKSNDLFTSKIKKQIIKKVEKACIDSIYVDENRNLGYKAFYHLDIPYYGQDDLALPLTRLLGNEYDLGLWSRLKRRSVAHLGRPGKIGFQVNYECPDGFHILPNDLLNHQFSNKIGHLKSEASKLTPSKLQMEISIDTLVDSVKPSDWADYVEFMDQVSFLLKQNIRIRSNNK